MRASRNDLMKNPGVIAGNQSKDFTSLLNGKTLAAAAGPACIGVDELKAFAVQSIGKFQYGACQIQEAFFIHYYLYAFIFKYMIGFNQASVEIQIIH